MSAWDTDFMFPKSDGVKARRKEFYPDWVIVTEPGDRMEDYRSAAPPTMRPLTVVVPKCHRDRCAYCDKQLTEKTRTRDHFVPRSKGGKGADNIVMACKSCNMTKGDAVLPTIHAAREYIRQKLNLANS